MKSNIMGLEDQTPRLTGWTRATEKEMREAEQHVEGASPAGAVLSDLRLTNDLFKVLEKAVKGRQAAYRLMLEQEDRAINPPRWVNSDNEDCGAIISDALRRLTDP
jgi:hypothetical protein